MLGPRFSWQKSVQFSSVAQSCPTLCDPTNRSMLGPPCLSLTTRVYSNSCPSSRWCHPAFSSSVVPFSSCPQPLPASGSFPMSQLFASGGKVLDFQLQHQSFQWIPRTDFLQDGLVGSPCSPRDSQESSPTPQFKSINSSALSFLHSPTLTSTRDHWKNHSLDQMDLCWQSNVSGKSVQDPLINVSEGWFHNLTAVWPWPSYLPSLCLFLKNL